MNKVWVAFLASAVAGSAMGQSAVFYHPGQDAKDQGISLRPWGSGTISDTDETAFQGSYSIRISTRNYFQGGIVGFGTPIDVAKDYLVKTNLLKIVFKLADSGVMGGGGGGLKGAGGGQGPGGRPPGFGGPGGGPGSRPPGIGGPGGGKGGFGGGIGGPGGQGGRPPGVGGPGGGLAPGGQGGPGGKGGFGGPGGPGGMGGAAAEVPVLKEIRLIITTTDGKKSEAYIPANTTAAADSGWKTVAIPLQAITGLDRTNTDIQSVAFAGNTTSTFYVGDLRVIDDSTPIRGEINAQPDINLALGDEITLSASGFGGSSILRFTWDFDDKDGIQVDAEGQSVKHKFRKAGNFVVTMTVSDYYGLKPSYSSTVKVTVNP